MENEKKTTKTTVSSPEERSRARRKIRALRIAIAVLLVAATLLTAAIVVVKLVLTPDPKDGDADAAPAVKRGIVSIVESTETMQQAKKLKWDFRDLVQALQGRELSRAAELKNTVDEDIRVLEEQLDSPLYHAAGVLPFLSEEYDSAKELVEIAKTANESLIGPLIELRQNYPLSDARTEEGFRVDYVILYLDFAESAWPVAKDLSERLDKTDGRVLKLVDSDGKLRKYADTLSELLKKAEPYLDYLPLARAFLGSGEDRLYVFAAQNTAEIRASGGFPGSVGALEIRDGVLSFVDFNSVYKVFSYGLPAGVSLTSTEKSLFQDWMDLAWDADFSPDFERVAEIWAKSYESRSGRKVDGVISATPVIIQRLLSFLGEITLSDGTVLNGHNAMRVLGHDLYFKYLSNQPEVRVSNRYDRTDELFAETAKKTLELLFSTVSIEHLWDYRDFIEDSFADRTMLLWMAREEEQEAVRRVGWAGTLNRDETKPEIGVFFNSTDPSKMGWFLDIDVSIGEGAADANGATSYPVTVTLSNHITPEERSIGGGYILGGSGGGIRGGVYIFAPAGGSIENCRCDVGEMKSANYRDLDLVYRYLTVRAGTPVVIEFDVTVSPAAESALGFMKTPTAQAYRD